jgi:putative chitinase
MLLKLGSEGEDVRKLQLKLGISPTGKFGPITESAVKSWQVKNGLKSDGVIGPISWGRLFSENTSQKTVITEPEVKPAMKGLKLEKLRGHIPDSVLSQIPDTISRFNLNTPLRLSHFLAQCGHESGGFKLVQENLNYSADGLRRIFPRHFPGNLAESYARNPQRIASRAYGGRMGNGDESSGDGFKFRGRGYIQLTGKDNYRAFGRAINEDLLSNPDKVATDYPLLSAAWFFTKNNLHEIADQGATDQVVRQITRRVNGGFIGLADRIKHFNEYYSLLL